MVRPNTDVTHTLNGRVKDLKERWGCSLDEAYQRVIERGVEELEDEIDDD
jgi:hypothetical protein